MSIKSSSKHLLDDFFQIVSSYSKNVILFLYAFFYFPSLLLTFVFFESYHRHMTGRPERKKNAKRLDLLGLKAESFLPASM